MIAQMHFTGVESAAMILNDDRARMIPKLDPREQHFRIPSSCAGMSLFLRYLPPMGGEAGRASRIVLYVHGATFPSGLSIAHRFAGRSWRDTLCDAGFHTWGFDFHGFGHSDRYPEMAEPANANPPLCRAVDGAEQIAQAAAFILDHHGAERLSIIAHSWGTIATGRFAAEHPAAIDRLVLFGPIARRAPRRDEAPPAAPAWRVVTLADQLARFTEDVPPSEPAVLSRADFDGWGERYLDSDADSRCRDPAGVKVPTGPFVDILHAWHGDLVYDPAAVAAPVAIIRGAWDGLIPDEDARWLFDAFAKASDKRDIKIARGTHLMHLETMRHALHAESIAFLMGRSG
jgi:pimeloyl-ACP methyl ester carboxylesterase